MKPPAKMKPCATCQGRGEVLKSHDAMSGAEYGKCPDCRGSCDDEGAGDESGDADEAE